MPRTEFIYYFNLWEWVRGGVPVNQEEMQLVIVYC